MDKVINKTIPLLFQVINKFENVESDIRFQKVKIWLCHIGENLNGSYFSREVLESAIPSLINTPILAFVENNKNGDKDFSDHREVLVRKDGEYATKYLGKAIGVIPSDNNAMFEERMCDDGITRTFLTVEGLLWTKFDDPIDIMNRDSVKAQSMELADDFEGQWEDDNLFHFTKISFYGACGLGFNVQPAMRNATIELQFSIADFKNETNKMMEQFKTFFSGTEEEEIHNNEESDAVFTKKDIAAKFNLTVNQLYDELDRKIGEVKYKTTNWWDEEVEVTRYYLRDFDDSFAYAVDRMSGYIDVKIPYSMDGDNVVFNLDGVARIKYVPMDWEGGSASDSEEEQEPTNFSILIESELKDVAINMTTALQEQINEKNDAYLELSGKFTSIQEELGIKVEALSEHEKTIEQLQSFKKKFEEEERKEKVDALFAKFLKCFTKDEVNEWREKETTYESFDQFEKDIKSFACDKLVESHKDVKPEFSQMGIPQDQDERPELNQSKDVWSRLSK